MAAAGGSHAGRPVDRRAPGARRALSPVGRGHERRTTPRDAVTVLAQALRALERARSRETLSDDVAARGRDPGREEGARPAWPTPTRGGQAALRAAARRWPASPCADGRGRACRSGLVQAREVRAARPRAPRLPQEDRVRAHAELLGEGAARLRAAGGADLRPASGPGPRARRRRGGRPGCAASPSGAARGRARPPACERWRGARAGGRRARSSRRLIAAPCRATARRTSWRRAARNEGLLIFFYSPSRRKHHRVRAQRCTPGPRSCKRYLVSTKRAGFSARPASRRRAPACATRGAGCRPARPCPRGRCA